MPAHAPNAIHNRRLVPLRAQLGFHLPTEVLPFLRADLDVHAPVGHDLDGAVGEQQINQHAIAVLGIPHAQDRKHLERTLSGQLTVEQPCAMQSAFDYEAYFTRVIGLGKFDRVLD